MTSKKQLQLHNPCEVQWNSLEGNHCARFCEKCSTHVIDLTTKSNKQIIELVMRTKGRVCGRIRRDQIDGVVYSKRRNRYFIKTFFAFVLGFATVTTADARIPPQVEKKTVKWRQDIRINSIDLKGKLFSKDTTITFSGNVVAYIDVVELTGVSVQLKGSDIGTVTDTEGNFDLILSSREIKKSKKKLVFSFVGYKTIEIDLPMNPVHQILVVLEEEVRVLGEIRIPWYKRLWWKITHNN